MINPIKLNECVCMCMCLSAHVYVIFDVLFVYLGREDIINKIIVKILEEKI